MKVKILRLTWVFVLVVSAFLLGRFVHPKPAGMSRAMSQTSTKKNSGMDRQAMLQSMKLKNLRANPPKR